MAQDKQLLLQVLSAMLPYGVVLQLSLWEEKTTDCRLTGIDEDGYLTADVPADCAFSVEDVKPYLRPMSSMTEEEKGELKKLSNEYLEDWTNSQTSIDKWKLDAKISYKRSVFYNSHYLDWNGLIELGLALEAPEGMYL